MQFDDPVYGTVSFSEPVLVGLIASKALQRLKGVSQIGANQFLQRGGFSRFEHSLGVAAVLARFGASVEEQAMGLIHDVSHPAFSHVIDFVFDHSKEEDFHEREFESFLKKTDIPAILQKHGFRVEDFADAARFPMLEQPLPGLCADRIDYFLRHLVHEYQERDRAERFLDALRFDAKDGFFISDADTGLEFAQWFLKENRELFCDAKMVAASWILADSIRSGLRVGALTKEELWTTDAQVIGKLRHHAHPSVQKPLEKLFAGFSAVEDEKIFDFSIQKKSRLIDPFVSTGDGKRRRVSEVFPEFEQALEDEKARLGKTRFIRVD